MPQVLVVDDEALIAVLVEDALRDHGLDVVVAHSGEEAIGRLREEPRSFQVLVTDINLGAGMDGFDVAKAARSLNESIKLVYVTGHPTNIPRAREEAHTYEKPFAVSDLAAQVFKMACQRG